MSTTESFAMPNLDQIRKQAKDLKRLVADGDPASRQRVRRSHPRHDDLDLDGIALRDAQVVLAREAGYAGWSQMVSGLGPQPTDNVDRWRGRGVDRLFAAAFNCAKDCHSATVHAWHIVRVLAYPESPAVAAVALWACGLDSEALASMTARPGTRDDSALPPVFAGSISSTPAQQMIFARAERLALADGTPMSDEHLLLALLYDGEGRDLANLGVVLDDLYRYLAEHGVRVPRMLPPPQPRMYRHVQRIYVPRGESSRSFHVTLFRFHHSSDRKWGTYISTARPGQQYYDAEATIDLGAIARATLNDDEWELMTVAEGTALEASARSGD